MTDKQIIIDGVDVSGCDELHINKANTIICEITGYLCEDRQNCYYKQLKRKEQECEELKRQNKRLDEVALYWHKRIFKVERSERKLKQTLTEIKEIAEKRNYLDYNECLDDILQKISEVEDG